MLMSNWWRDSPPERRLSVSYNETAVVVVVVFAVAVLLKRENVPRNKKRSKDKLASEEEKERREEKMRREKLEEVGFCLFFARVAAAAAAAAQLGGVVQASRHPARLFPLPLCCVLLPTTGHLARSFFRSKIPNEWGGAQLVVVVVVVFFVFCFCNKLQIKWCLRDQFWTTTTTAAAATERNEKLSWGTRNAKMAHTHTHTPSQNYSGEKRERRPLEKEKERKSERKSERTNERTKERKKKIARRWIASRSTRQWEEETKLDMSKSRYTDLITALCKLCLERWR